jgi:hypothetical protein
VKPKATVANVSSADDDAIEVHPFAGNGLCPATPNTGSFVPDVIV